jgi:hypothetical protein
MGDTGSQQGEAAYEAIAPVYDEFTANHNYELWLRNLLPALERHGLKGQRLLDVGLRDRQERGSDGGARLGGNCLRHPPVHDRHRPSETRAGGQIPSRRFF